jgi:hypothetical protein
MSETEADRRQLLAELHKKLRKTDHELGYARQHAESVREQLRRSGDAATVWAWWEITALDLCKQLELIYTEIPAEEEMAVFLDGHWKLWESVCSRVDDVRDLLDTQEKRCAGRGYVVDAMSATERTGG